MKKFLWSMLLVSMAAWPVRAEILIAPASNQTEVYAAKELQRYFYQLTGTFLPIVQGDQISGRDEPLCLVGTPLDWPMLQKLAQEGRIRWKKGSPGPQGYVLKTTRIDGHPALVIAGAEPIGALYGVYGLLQDHFGVAFHLDGDVLPPQPLPSAWPELNEVKTPAVAIRGVLPWTNFPQSPSSYSWEDWKFILDQMARMRMNFLHIHNYSGELGHNEMFANFEVAGKLSRVWMATARSGQAWGGMPGWEVNRYLFGAADLFDDDDFGAECALHNDRLDNAEVFRKGVTLFQRVLDYAHRRGIKVGLGLDLNLIPKSYGMEADDPAVVDARAGQIAADYPDLDYLMCFESEGIAKDADARAKWRGIFDRFYGDLKTHAPSIRIAVSGWGIDPKDVETMPDDVICAPIAPYAAKCESGAVYGQREYWGCPWLERDMHSSEYYYPYNIDLSDTVKAWQDRAPNMAGFYCLTWRLADAVAPKLDFIAQAPWDSQEQLKDAQTVYHRFAASSYGAKAADPITAIIDQNEPFASDFGECEPTRPFAPDAGAKAGGTLFNLSSFVFSGEGVPDLKMAATDCLYQHGTLREAPGPDGKCLGWIQAGDWTVYRTNPKLDFNPQWTRFTANVASQSKGGKIEIHLDAPDGTKIGEVTVPPTGGWGHWTDVSAPLTPTKGEHSFYLVYVAPESEDQLAKADDQLKTIDACVAEAETPGQKYRLGLLRDRIAAERDQILLDLHFSASAWGNLPGPMESWVRNFIDRVTDISSLGNVVSVENRYVQKDYLSRVYELRKDLRARPPEEVTARGTHDGALITWTNELPGARGFFVQRDGKNLNATPLPPSAREFTDTASGDFTYTVTALLWDDLESPRSLPAHCQAGAADKTPPRIYLISPPTTAIAGQPVAIEARLLDNRAYDLLSATLCYRQPGEKCWIRLPMTRRVKGVFTAVLPFDAITERGIEYQVEATDGDNPAVFPSQPLSLTVEAALPSTLPANAVVQLEAHGQALQWAPVPNAFLYRIYRAQTSDFTPGPENRLTYVAASQTPSFEDNGEDLLAHPLQGTWYYRVTAVDRAGYEGRPSEAIGITP